ncbi:copper resistance protein B [Halomonas elongata]|uniref:Copper resistance protein B n=1 Tax=Halomonas elongata (strain ATCC 33173 / DSM 2581 / NBRC 15536 / NCIMB 2198 / 1H9) TaxID=768066 RepID=E1V8X2_HALED|nr:copper resistance protein B [Halomonas elongata]WBF18988.1 copper resistance protein B [Halomonas elongata]WPU47848.1 copper resistance protein B [Halomonas elongata DSM 2581]CBV41747.1 copper resistance protein PcoB [Halomonas elongata DSM 2581]
MDSKILAVGIGASFTLLIATSTQADDDYNAPHDWPTPIVEHSRGSLLIDRLEYTTPDKGEEALAWDFRAWYGGDIKRIYLKGEGENIQGDGKDAEFENLDLLYSRLIAPFWELQGGIGYQGGIATDTSPERYFGVINLQGLAPYRFDTDISLRVSDDGDISGSLETEYDIRLTQRLLLQPRLEVAASANDVPEFGIGEGLNSVRTGLRLRYEISRKFAPYIGGYWQKSYGNTADIAQDDGEAAEDTGIVAGIRMWY